MICNVYEVGLMLAENAYKVGERVELTDEFREKFFHNLFQKTSTESLSSKLPISRSMLYHYKNKRTKTVPLSLLEEFIKITGISEQELKNNTIRTISSKDLRNKGLNIGREFVNLRKKRASNLDVDIRTVFDGRNLDVEKLLSNSGYFDQFRRKKGLVTLIKKPTIKENKIFLPLKVYIPQKKKYIHKIIVLPRKIEFNSEFLYFLGLVMGDGLSVERLGIINTDLNLLKFTFDFLEKFSPTDEVKGIIHVHHPSLMRNVEKYKKNLENMGIKKIKVIKMYKAHGKIVYLVFLVNQPLSKIIYFLIRNIKNIWEKLSYVQRGAFLAGIFDTEGNVNKWDNNLRISQETEGKRKIIEHLLKEEGYHFRYDGNSFVIGNKKETRKEDFKRFRKQILPHTKHDEKIKDVKELFDGNLLYDSFKEVLRIISTNGGIIHNELAKKLEKTKCRRELKALEMMNYVTKSGYPFKYFVTNKGLEWIKGD